MPPLCLLNWCKMQFRLLSFLWEHLYWCMILRCEFPVVLSRYLHSEFRASLFYCVR